MAEKALKSIGKQKRSRKVADGVRSQGRRESAVTQWSKIQVKDVECAGAGG